MGIWKQISEYLYLRKPDNDIPRSRSLKFMHGINRLSILLFLLALVVLAIKLLLKR